MALCGWGWLWTNLHAFLLWFNFTAIHGDWTLFENHYGKRCAWFAQMCHRTFHSNGESSAGTWGHYIRNGTNDNAKSSDCGQSIRRMQPRAKFVHCVVYISVLPSWTEFKELRLAIRRQDKSAIFIDELHEKFSANFSCKYQEHRARETVPSALNESSVRGWTHVRMEWKRRRCISLTTNPHRNAMNKIGQSRSKNPDQREDEREKRTTIRFIQISVEWGNWKRIHSIWC